MPRERIETVYKFDELSDRAKERAREWYREGALDYEWWACCYDTIETLGNLLGISFDTKSVPLMNGSTRQDPRIYFTLDHGGGVSINGHYSYRKGSVEAVRQEFGDTEPVRIAQALQKAQARGFYKFTANLRGTGRDEDTRIEVDHENMGYEIGPLHRAAEDIRDTLGDFVHWAYKLLDGEWEYINSDEYVDENIRINEYEFDEEGNRA